MSVGTLSAVAYVSGILIHGLCRDRWDFVAPLFYAMRLPLLGLSAATSGFCWRQVCWRRAALSCWVVATITATVWGLDSLAWRGQAPQENSISLLLWNINRGNLGYEHIAREIEARDTDVVALVEATGRGQDESMWSQLVPSYRAYKLGSGLTLLLRGEMVSMEPGMLAEALKFRILHLKLKQGEFALTIVDVASDPLLPRQPAFRVIGSLLDRHPNLPHVLVGDFNTPPGSVNFDRLRNSYVNAFDARGTGLRETWPMFCPVLHLDQVWGDARIEWLRCEHGWSLRSDHRPVVAQFSLKSSP